MKSPFVKQTFYKNLFLQNFSRKERKRQQKSLRPLRPLRLMKNYGQY